MSWQQQRDRFTPGTPLEEASTPPSSWYLDDDFAAAEGRLVFGRHWQPIARKEQLAQRGSYVTAEFAGQPIVAVRGDDGELRAFFNVCRHHAACVMKGHGQAETLVCPYHGWKYRLDGSLLKAPRLGAVRSFARDDYGLRPLEIDSWGPWVFVRSAPGPINLAEMMRPLDERLDTSELEFFERRTYEIDCNWKVFVDNYLDGGYHVAHLHRGLAAQLALDDYRLEIFDWLSIQSCKGASTAQTEPSGQDFQARVGEEALYAWVHPGFMINRYGPFMDTNYALPISPNRCLTIFDYYVEKSAGASQDFLRRSLAASEQVQNEDIEICASVQRGLTSSGYDVGRYSVQHEAGALHFHRLLHRDLSTEQPAEACTPDANDLGSCHA